MPAFVQTARRRATRFMHGVAARMQRAVQLRSAIARLSLTVMDRARFNRCDR
jgi:hypothetical protein